MPTFRREKGARKSHPITPRTGTIYGPPSDQHVAEETHARSLEDARASADQLDSDFRGAKTREKKKHVWRATLDEANRLEIASHNMRNSADARMRLSEEEKVFRSRADRMHRELFPAGG